VLLALKGAHPPLLGHSRGDVGDGEEVAGVQRDRAVESRCQQRADQALVEAGCGRLRLDHDPSGVAVRLQHPPVFGREHLQLRPPGQVVRRLRHLGDDGLGEEAEELLLVADMPIEGARAHAEALGQGAHGQALEARLIQQVEGGADDLLAAIGAKPDQTTNPVADAHRG
jgi:hypothetical protein